MRLAVFDPEGVAAYLAGATASASVRLVHHVRERDPNEIWGPAHSGRARRIARDALESGEDRHASVVSGVAPGAG